MSDGRDLSWEPVAPTVKQCDVNEAVLGPYEGIPAFAAWYPQMGGYVARCIVQPNSKDGVNECFECWVWHDGNFPFGTDPHQVGEERQPAVLHHCDPQQFIEFGQKVEQMLRKITEVEE